MPDWNTYVRQHLGSLRLPPEDIRDVTDELAGHLEKCYEALRARGLSEEEALLQTRLQAGDWRQLRRGVNSERRRVPLMDRVKQIWIPSLLTLFAAWTILALLIIVGLRPLIWHSGDVPSVILYVPWLLLLPLVGAAGAYLSRRAKATGWRVYFSGAFPAVAIAIVFLLVMPFRLVIDPYVVHDFAWAGLAAMTVSWVVIPGIALCLGIALQGFWKLSAAA
jgi:hypothetical protein